MTRLLLFGFVAAFLLFFLLVTVASQVQWAASYYLWIFWLNIIVVSVLGLATVIRLSQLWRSIRAQQYGSRLARLLFTILALTSIIPSLIVYGLSYRFLDSAIESWFNLEIDQTVEGGLQLAKFVMDEEARRLERSADKLALTLGSMNPSERTNEIAKWRDLLGVMDIAIFDDNMQTIGHSYGYDDGALTYPSTTSSPVYPLSADLPDAFTIRDIGYRANAKIETLLPGDHANSVKDNPKPTYRRIRVLVKIPTDSVMFGDKKQQRLPTIGKVNRINAINHESLIDDPLSGVAVDGNATEESIKPLNTFLSKVLYLQILQVTPTNISEGSQKLAVAYQHYGELREGRRALKKLFLTALTILLVLTLITALSLAFHYSNRFIAPLSLLVEGTRAVAKGDFSRQLFEGRGNHDEFDQLIKSFNDMLSELRQAQESANLAKNEMIASRSFLENVLNHLNAGVMIFEEDEKSRGAFISALAQAKETVDPLMVEDKNDNGEEGEGTRSSDYRHCIRLLFSNEAAGRMLGQDLAAWKGSTLIEWEPLRPFAHAISDKIYQSRQTALPMSTIEREWTNQLDIRLPQGFRSLMLRGTKLPDDQRWVVVFDDISDLLRAQHLHIWSEMARRLAHEIKNPLTPIQLSAERMMMKIGDKLTDSDRDFFERSVGTIVSQVDAIKTLVNQFREMARPASTQLEAFRVNDLLQEVVALYDDKRIHLKMPRKKLKVFADRHQLRQVLHNLILNAEQANYEKTGEWNHSRLLLEMGEGVAPWLHNEDTQYTDEAKISADTYQKGVWINIVDIGGGFSQTILDKAFQPNVTSKIKGSGLGLSIVRKIIEEHRGMIRLGNIEWTAGTKGYDWDDVSPKGQWVKGAKISLWLPLSKDEDGARPSQNTPTTT